MTPHASWHFPSFQSPKTSKQQLRLFERSWTNFPLGWLPLDLLTSVSRRLVAFLAFHRSLGLPPAPLSERLAFRYEAEYAFRSHSLGSLQARSHRDLESVAFREISTLLFLLLAAPPRRTNPYLHREAFYSTMLRLGQVYQVCKQRWTAREARAIVLEQMERVCQAWLRGQMLLLLAARSAPLPPGKAARRRAVRTARRGGRGYRQTARSPGHRLPFCLRVPGRPGISNCSVWFHVKPKFSSGHRATQANQRTHQDGQTNRRNEHRQDDNIA